MYGAIIGDICGSNYEGSRSRYMNKYVELFPSGCGVTDDDEFEELHELALDYRIKSVQSAVLKYNRYYPDHQARKVFDVLLGFRSLCDNYDDVLELRAIPEFRIADMTKGKAKDDGYRGVHAYYQLDGSHYPIEIQYNTYYDRQFNNWLHKYIYKKNYDNEVGLQLRNLYERAKIQTEQDFKEAMNDVLSNR